MRYEIQNVSFGNGVIDVYMPYFIAKKPWPTVVSIHGGGWTGGSEDDGPTLGHALKLVEHGFMVCSVRYSLAPKRKWPYQFVDLMEAISFIRHRYPDKVGKIGLIGASAGAYIAAAYALLVQPLPSVLLYGPYDLRRWQATNPDTANIYLPKVFGNIDKANLLTVVEKTLQRRIPYSLIIHGTKDQLVSCKQSIKLKLALDSRYNGRAEILLDEDAGHCLNGSKRLKSINKAILNFFTKHLNKE